MFTPTMFSRGRKVGDAVLYIQTVIYRNVILIVVIIIIIIVN